MRRTGSDVAFHGVGWPGCRPSSSSLSGSWRVGLTTGGERPTASSSILNVLAFPRVYEGEQTHTPRSGEDWSMADQHQLPRDRQGEQTKMAEVETFVRTSLPALYRLAHALCQHQGSAEDLVADTIVTVVARWHTVTTAPMAFTRRVMINLFLNQMRHRNVVREDAVEYLPDRPDSGPNSVDGVASRIDIARALAKLAPDLRAVVVLRFLADMSVSEVGLTLGRPSGSIRRLTHEAIVSLRKEFLTEGVANA